MSLMSLIKYMPLDTRQNISIAGMTLISPLLRVSSCASSQNAKTKAASTIAFFVHCCGRMARMMSIMVVLYFVVSFMIKGECI